MLRVTTDLKDSAEMFVVAIERTRILEAELTRGFPPDIEATVTLDVSPTGSMRFAWVYLPVDAMVDGHWVHLSKKVLEEDTRKVVDWLKRFGKITRDTRQNGFYYAAESPLRTDKHGNWSTFVIVENAHPPNCKLVYVKKETLAAVAHCEGDPMPEGTVEEAE